MVQVVQELGLANLATRPTVGYKVRCLMAPVSGVFLGTCMFLFCSKSTSMQVARNSCWEALVGCSFRSQNWFAKAVASAVERIWCSLWLHAGCCEPAVRGFLACLAGCRVTCTHSAPPCTPRASPFAHLRFLWCIGGSNSKLREFVYRHGSCLLTQRGSRQQTHCPKWTKFSNMSSVQHADPGCSK